MLRFIFFLLMFSGHFCILLGLPISKVWAATSASSVTRASVLAAPAASAAPVVPVPQVTSATSVSEHKVQPAFEIHKTQKKFFETQDIETLLSLLDKNTLVIFDIDHTIFRTKTAFGSSTWGSELIRQEMAKEGLSREVSTKKYYPIWMKAQKYTDIVLLDNNILKVIQSAHKKACGFIGLTERQPAVAEITEWQLNKFGIDFARSAFSPLTFNALSKYPILFRKGIIYSNNFNDIGQVFRVWLSQIKAQLSSKNLIKRIVFVDMDDRNLKSMAEASESLGIEFIGLKYSVLEKHQKKIDPALLEKEKEILNNNLSDSETWLFLEKAGSYKGSEAIAEQELNPLN